MSSNNRVVNYDGSIAASPQQLAYPENVGEIQAILKDRDRYPSPVRAMGSFHSLTPCVWSEGTIVNMHRMNRMIEIDRDRMTFTAQAGMQMIEASRALRAQQLQFMTNIEIGNMTLGSAACCHSKDALDGIEFGEVNSYVTKIKWVGPAGELREASEENNRELLYLFRSSYGLCGIVYEVTFRIKPMEAIHLSYLPRPIDELTEAEVAGIVDQAEGLICWTVGRTAVFETRKKVDGVGPLSSVQAETRRRLWNHSAAFWGRTIDQTAPSESARNITQDARFSLNLLLYNTLHATGGISIYAPDKMVDYSETAPSARYAFTFWAFPRAQWLGALREYLDFSEAHFKKYGFRCNMPLGSYYIREDKNSLLSYTHEGEIFSIDPIHASTNQAEWDRFLHEFNDWAYARKGIPLLNQSPFVERKHVEAAYGERWRTFSDFVRSSDPEGRMLNPYFRDLLSAAS